MALSKGSILCLLLLTAPLWTPSQSVSPIEPTFVPCSDGQFHIYTSWLCDGIVDCLDGSDEDNCQAAEESSGMSSVLIGTTETDVTEPEVTTTSIEGTTETTTALDVSIEITYTSPDEYPEYSPPNYRAASSVSLRCVASGYSGSVSYEWSSTCDDCFASGYNNSNSSDYVDTSDNNDPDTVSESFLRSRDAGVHTCTVTDELGNTGSASITMRVVGVGIYLQYAQESHVRSGSGVQGPQPSNSFATVTRRYTSTRLDMYCCSNSSTAYDATITTPDGFARNTNYWNGQITRHNSGTYAGCIQLRYSRYYYSSFYLGSNYDGIYTCTIPDSQGQNLQEHIGLYDQYFSNRPDIYQLQYQAATNETGSIALICRTRNSPPSNIRWYKDDGLLEFVDNTTDDNLIDINDDSIDMSVSIINRHSSSFTIMLTIFCDSLDDIAGHYRCEVSNRLGSDSATHTIQGLEFGCSSEFVVGETVNCWCSGGLMPSRVGWNGGSSSSLTIPVTTDIHGQVHTCSVVSSEVCGDQEESIIINTIIPDDWAAVGIHNSTGGNALNNTDYTLTCIVTPISGMNLPYTVEWVGPDGDVVVSEGNRVVGEVEVEGTVSTLTLSFRPVLTSNGGSYTCRATVSVPWMTVQPPQNSASVHMPVTTQAMFQLKLYPLPLCINWDIDKAFELEESIKMGVEKAIRERCNCAFSSSAIYSGLFSCQSASCKSDCDQATHVTYRAIVNGTTDLLSADQLIQHVEDWRDTRGTLLHKVLLLSVASRAECSVRAKSLEDAEC